MLKVVDRTVDVGALGSEENCKEGRKEGDEESKENR
jgi:hypothetical protein